jgi:Lrp/AsnC family leucine-responsive transcriptional regulator
MNQNELDTTDRAILLRLMRDGRATWADLAADLDLTAPAIAMRVRRLQDSGVIRQFAAWVEPGVLARVSAFISVSMGKSDGRARFREQVEKLDVVQECHQIAGEDEFLLKVRCRSLEQLADLVGAVLPRLGAASVRTSVVLSTVKETPLIPIPEPE